MLKSQTGVPNLRGLTASGTWSKFLKRFFRNRLAIVGLAITLFLMLTAILAPQLAPMDPNRQDLSSSRAPPGAEYRLGADEFGRDMLSRLLYGSRIALLVGTVSVGIAFLIGLIVGSLAGYFGGILDSIVMRLTDIMLAFPYLLLALLIATALGSGVFVTTLAVGIYGAPNFIRMVRAGVLEIRQMDFIEAAQALGAGHSRVILFHVIPNNIAGIVVFATLFMAQAIQIEAALSFLGIGVQPPEASWGLMVASGRNYLRVAPHITLFPGIAIALAVLGFNLLGDGLRDALDPKSSPR